MHGLEVDDVRTRGRPKKIWSEVTEKNCMLDLTILLWMEDDMGRWKWRMLILKMA